MSSETETVTCYCLQCKSEIGAFENSWEGIGKTYSVPRVVRNATGLKKVGAVQLAEGPLQVGSAIEHSSLQDIACMTCDKILGLRCDSAPQGHLLKKDQYLLCLKLMSIISDKTGKKATLYIVKTHALLNPANTSRVSSQKTSMLSGTPRPGNLFSPVNRMRQTPIAMSSPVIHDSVLFTTILEQRKDIDRIDTAVNRLEKDMLEIKSFMKEIRQEMAEVRQARHTSRDSPILGERVDMAEHLNAFAPDILSVKEKSNRVGELRSEVTYLRARMKNLEESTRRALGAAARLLATPASFDEQLEIERLQNTDLVSSRKRQRDEVDEGELNDLITDQELHNKRQRYPEKVRPEPSRRFSQRKNGGKEIPSTIPDTRSQTPELTTTGNNKRRDESPILGNYGEDNIMAMDRISHSHQYDNLEVQENNSPHKKDKENRQIPNSTQDSQATGEEIPNSIPDSTREHSQSFTTIYSLIEPEVPNSSQTTSDFPLPPNRKRTGRPQGSKNKTLETEMPGIIDLDDGYSSSGGRRLRQRRPTFHASSTPWVDRTEVAGTSPLMNIQSEVEVGMEVRGASRASNGDGDEGGNGDGDRKSLRRRSGRSAKRVSVDLDEGLR